MQDSDALAILKTGDISPNKKVRLDENPAAVYLAKLSKNGRRVQADALNVVANLLLPEADYLSFPWHKLEYQHVQAVRTFLQEEYSISSINRMLSAVRETVKQAWLLKQIPADQYLRVKQVNNVKGSRLPAGRYITAGEIKAILDVCIADKSPAGFRDAAIIAWMVSGGGPRRAEVVSVDLGDYDPDSGQIKIVGKGNNERTNYLENGAYDAMADWLAVRGDAPGPLFIPINKAGTMILRRMTSQAIYNMLNRRIEQAGIKDFSPHDLRRTFISNMLDAGADLATTSKIVGHEDLKTTAVYDRRPEQAKKKATQLLSVPYKRRLGS
jgi:site-specific recombinase XerD